LIDLMSLASGERASNQVRAVAELRLSLLRDWLTQEQNVTRDDNRQAFLSYAANQIRRFQDDPKKMNLTKANDPPDGQPIGSDWWALSDRDWCDWR
jgi:hypothetical protein